MPTRKSQLEIKRKNLGLLGWVLSVGSLLVLVACVTSGGGGSPLKVKASISPAPIVGQDVTLHIEMTSIGPQLPNTTLEVTLPAGWS